MRVPPPEFCRMFPSLPLSGFRAMDAATLKCWCIHLCILLTMQGSVGFTGSALSFSNRALKSKANEAVTAVSSPAGVITPSYWDKPHPEVPEKFLKSIREEPWRGMLEPCVDHPLTEIEVQGEVPAALQGTLFRNGCGRNRDADRAYKHWFDGDGHITKIVFKDGRVFAQNRFVSTGVWDPSAPEGQKSSGSRRGWTSRPGGWLKNVFRLPGNPVNTSVMVKGGKLYALCEGGKPVEMDPVTLETFGERDLGGIKAFYSAHPTTDVKTGETFNIGIGGSGGSVELTRLSPDGVVEKSSSFTPPASLFWHDNGLTSEYVVAVTSPYAAPLKSILKSLLGFGALADAFKWDDTMKSEAFFFSRDTLELVKRVELPGLPSSYHIVNSCQEKGKGGTVSVTIAKLREGGRDKLEDTFKDLMTQRFSSDIGCDAYKYEIDVGQGRVVDHGPAAPIEGALPMELATIDPRYVGKPNRYVYTNALVGDAGFLNGLQRGDLQGDNEAAWTTHDFGASRYAGEPIFVPRSKDAEEGEGYLIVGVYNTKTHTTDVEVLDAQKVDAPPVCVARIPWHMGSSFHGVFCPETFV